MTIRDRLIASAALTTLLSAILGLVLITNAREVTRLVDRARWADELVDQASLLGNLTYDYLTHPSPRAQDQWSIVQKRIEGSLDRHRLLGTPEEERLAGLRRHNRWLVDAFGRMVEAQADLESASATPAAARELSARLAGQIASRIQALEREIIALQERALQSIALAQKGLVALILLFVGALVVALPISGLLIVRSIARPVAALMRGTAVVAAGDLSHKVGTLADDELGELSRAFDLMTESLRATTVSREELARASRYKSEFLANMSHELRTPLNSLLILSRALARNDECNLDADQIKKAETIRDAGQDLLHLINETLDLSKVEAGKLEIHSAVLDLSDLVRGIEAQFRPIALEKGLDFQIRTGTGVPPTLATDSKRLEQILRNLISNAIKFTKSGSVTLEIARPDEPHADFGADALAFAVVDTGIGIAHDQQNAIFDAFHQVETTVARGHGGTGLGLAISRKLAALLGGGIGLESRPGKGSRFTLILPCIYTGAISEERKPEELRPLPALRETTAHSPSPESMFVSDDREGIEGDDRSILVIEDDRPFAEIVRDRIRARGLRCLVAGDGTSGLLLAREHLPSAVILDLLLPDLDGRQVLEAIQSDIATRHIPVQVISVREPDRALMSSGIIGHIVKPVDEGAIDAALAWIESRLASRKKRVLLALIEESDRSTLLDLIESEEILVDVAHDAGEAAEMRREGRFDLVVWGPAALFASGSGLPSTVEPDPVLAAPPVLLYSGRALTPAEKEALAEREEEAAWLGVLSPAQLLSQLVLHLNKAAETMESGACELVSRLLDPDRILKDRRVLLVDDDLRGAFALSAELRQHGIYVTLAENGRQALERLEEPPDTELVLMDVMMPVMDGYEAMRRIREQERFEALPIVALTAKAMPGERERCIEAGASDYLAKPVRIEVLVALLRVWLSCATPIAGRV